MMNLLKKIESLKFILGSSSTARKNIFDSTGYNYQIVQSDFEENLDKSGKTPEEYCLLTCKGKFDDLCNKLKDEQFDVLVTGDTIQKPQSHEQHCKFLQSYSNSSVVVMTAIIIGVKNKQGQIEKYENVTTAEMFVDELPEGFVEYFIQKEPDTKYCSGGFKKENMLRYVIKRIEGDPECVQGLPIKQVINLLCLSSLAKDQLIIQLLYQIFFQFNQENSSFEKIQKNHFIKSIKIQSFYLLCKIISKLFSSVILISNRAQILLKKSILSNSVFQLQTYILGNISIS